jgi:hypothetical protein
MVFLIVITKKISYDDHMLFSNHLIRLMISKKIKYCVWLVFVALLNKFLHKIGNTCTIFIFILFFQFCDVIKKLIHPTNQEVGAPPPPSFPHTMLSVKRVKDNMQQAFIEKFFTNREIGTNVQTRYLRFKGMSYESESYLCDISCV